MRARINRRLCTAAIAVILTIAGSGGFAEESKPAAKTAPSPYPLASSLPNVPGWDLQEIRARNDKVPYDKIRAGGVFTQSQRTIFRDCVFGGEIWKITHSRVHARHYYSSVQAWNANGSIFGIEAYYPDQLTKAYLVDADGTAVREVPFRRMKNLAPGVRFGFKCPAWDLEKPEVMYGLRNISRQDAKDQPNLPPEQQKLTTTLYACDVVTAQHWPIREVGVGYMDSTPFWYQGRQWAIIIHRPYAGRKIAFSAVSLDGKDLCTFPREWFPQGARTDSVILTRIPEYPFTVAGLNLSPKGDRVIIDPRYLGEHPELATGVVEKSVVNLGGAGSRGRLTAGHSCYSIDGSGCVGVGSQITCVDYAADRGYYQRRIVLTAGGSGHTSWLNRDKRWVFMTLVPDGKNPFDGMLIKLAADGSEVAHRIVFHNSSYKEYTAEAHGSISPDGTKLAFASDALGSSPKEVSSYIAVVKHPEPPADLKAKAEEGGAVRLTWKKPLNSVEHKGVYLYRSIQSGVGYEAITTEPVSGESFTDKTAPSGKPLYYVATSVEHSGIESSRYSVEAAVAPSGAVRVFVEAEDGALALPARTERDVTAVGDECAWLFAGSTLSLSCAVPSSAECTIWARHKNEADARLKIAQTDASLPAAREWQWTKIARKRYDAGSVTVALAADKDVKVDRLCLASDDAFCPKGRGNGDETPTGKVTGLTASDASGNWLKLAWQAPANKDIRYFNIYCSRTPGFSPSQKTLVWSPPADARAFWDYGLQPETTYYYRVTAVDRAGNESAPSDEVQIKTGAARAATAAGEAPQAEKDKDPAEE